MLSDAIHAGYGVPHGKSNLLCTGIPGKKKSHQGILLLRSPP